MVKTWHHTLILTLSKREKMSSWQQLLQQEAGVLISTPKRAKRVRRKRVRTSPLSSSPGTLTSSVLSGAGARVGLSSGPATLQWETSIRRAVPDSGDVRTRFFRTRLARLGVEIKTPASCCSSCCQDDIFSRLLRVKINVWRHVLTIHGNVQTY